MIKYNIIWTLCLCATTGLQIVNATGCGFDFYLRKRNIQYFHSFALVSRQRNVEFRHSTRISPEFVLK